MKTYQFKKIILLSLLLGLTQVSWAACDQTLSPGANLASVVSSAVAGSTICLNNGNYGTTNFSGISKSNYVTVQSLTGLGASISPQISNSKFLRFTNLTISGATLSSSPSNIQITASTFTSGLLINMRGASKANYPLNILIDGNTFSNLGPTMWEGRISVGDDNGAQPSMGVTISNNKIKDGCLSDGIQAIGGASGIQIGPGNVFSNIIQSGPVHCDSIQFYGSGVNNTITGNYFTNVSVALQHQGGTPSGTVFSNNIIDNVAQIQIGGTSGFVFENNTIRNLKDVFAVGPSSQPSRNTTFRNNILTGNGVGPDMSNITGTFSHQLCSNSSQCVGTNQIIGFPTFTGGTIPTTMEGYQLTSSSLGYKNGSDGQDRGYNSITLPTPLDLAPPSNLKVN